MSKNPTGTYLTFLVTLGFMAMTGMLMCIAIPESNRDLFFTGYGIMGSAFVLGMNYWLGTSKSSADKTAAGEVSKSP